MVKRKIFIIITKSNWGGAQRYVHDLALHYKDIYDVSVIVGGEGEMLSRLKEAGIRVVSLPFLQRDISVINDIKTGFFLFDLFRREKPDTVHLNSSKIGGLGSFFARLSGVHRIIFTLHGLALNENRATLSKFIIGVAYWFTILFSHTTIAVSDTLKKQCSRFFPFVSKKVVVIKNGVSKPDLVSREEARTYLSLNQNDFIIGIVAELHPIKGHRYLVEGFDQFIKRINASSGTNCTLAVLGEGEERKNIENQISSLNLGMNVKLCGHISQASRYLKAFDIFIMTSLSEGLPYAPLEAGAAGLPVIATAVGGIPEIITDNQTGILIPPKNPEAIAEAIKKLAENKDVREALAHNLQYTVQTEFTVEKMAAETTKFY